MQSASKTLKRVTLELYVPNNKIFNQVKTDVDRGGNDPAIVFPDVDVDKVAEKVRRFLYPCNLLANDGRLPSSLSSIPARYVLSPSPLLVIHTDSSIRSA